MSLKIRKTHNLYQVVVDELKTVYQDSDLKKVKAFIARSKNELKTLDQKSCCMSHQVHALSYSQTINW